MPIPGEDRVHDHPVEVTVVLDRRGPRDGSPVPPPPAALSRVLPLERREEPRLPARSPLDPMRPVAEAAAHLLRHVAAVAPLERPPARASGSGDGPAPAPRPPLAAGAALLRQPGPAAIPVRPRIEEVFTLRPPPGVEEDAPAERRPNVMERGPVAAGAAIPALERGPVAAGAAIPAPERVEEIEVDLELGPVADPEPDAPADQILMPPRPPVWRRLAAWTVDGALVAALPLVALAAATRGVTGEDGLPVPLGTLLLGSGPVLAAALLLAALVAFVYLTLSSALGGRTPGAALAGLGLVSCESGEPPGLARAALRAALAVAGTFACFAGPLSALLDGEGRALHDKLAGTVVMVDR